MNRVDSADATRRALLAAGRTLFAELDYLEVSAETIVDAAKLTRGALYHHFDGKRGLFEAVFLEQERRAADIVSAAVDAGADPFDRAERGANAFLELCAEPEYSHIVLRQGPIALGWARTLEADREHLGVLLVGAAEDLLAAGLINPHPAELVAGAFYGALTDLAFAVAGSDDRVGTLRDAEALIRDLLRGMRSSTDGAPGQG